MSEALTTPTSTTLTSALASGFARIALRHIGREYPNKLDHVIGGPEDLRSPRALHPIFYGSFDWHSCVHGYWLLTHLYRRFPDLPEAQAIRDVVDAHFTIANVDVELAYLARPSSATFERPYGWAWLLALAADLQLQTSAEGRRWSDVLAPLAKAFADRFCAHLPQATYPIRTGTHANSAFALALALDYADSHADAADLAEMIRAKAMTWFGCDRDCQAWEPSGDDFLSPALVEVECMRRVFVGGASSNNTGNRSSFETWLDVFLPRLASGDPQTLFEPVFVSNRSDGKIAHLDGLNLSRAWCFGSLAATLPIEDARQPLVRAAAERHLAAGLAYVSGDYMGEHWLATYALLALLAPMNRRE